MLVQSDEKVHVRAYHALNKRNVIFGDSTAQPEKQKYKRGNRSSAVVVLYIIVEIKKHIMN